MKTNLFQPKKYYNNFFHPNVCHVCKNFTNDLRVCPWCYLISYCCKRHMQFHRKQHEKFCQALLKLDIFYCHSMPLNQWNKLKKINVKKIKKILDRDLEPYEEQILLFAKSCIRCYQQRYMLIACEICMSINMCHNHISPLYEHDCKNLRLCKNLDIFTATKNEESITIPKALLDISIIDMSNMKSYLKFHIEHIRNLGLWTNNDVLYSNYLSKPCTLLFAMKEADLLHYILTPGTFIVHVIAENFMDKNSLLAWEMFLHQFSNDTTLLIIIIVPRLREVNINIQLCETCNQENRKLLFNFISLTYETYLCTKMQTEPDIIIGFDVDVANNDTLNSIKKILMCQNIPLVLSCKSENKAQQMVTKIKEDLLFKPKINKKNSFASYRPYRDYENNSTYFPNQHVIVYLKNEILNDIEDTELE